MKLAIVLGSTREGRKSPLVGEAIMKHSSDYPDIEFDLIDIQDYDLPLFKKNFSSYGGSEPEYDRLNALHQRLSDADGYIFVVSEYNHGISASLKNVFEYYYTEFNNKAAGLVSYGLDGGVRAAEHVRLIAAELRMPTVRAHVTMNIFTEFTKEGFNPQEFNTKRLHTLIGEVKEWSDALSVLRNK
ncbi:NAD(P)H-dependent oxidoreductase [Aerococcaceae bacterium DSM 111021]|nr:NAD(P)H-dependent oxidoreductase [Aerococcaceae bacterium DSM 111021]